MLITVGYQLSSVMSMMKAIDSFVHHCFTSIIDDGDSTELRSSVGSIKEYIHCVQSHMHEQHQERRSFESSRKSLQSKNQWLSLDQLQQWKDRLSKAVFDTFNRILSDNVSDQGYIDMALESIVCCIAHSRLSFTNSLLAGRNIRSQRPDTCLAGT